MSGLKYKVGDLIILNDGFTSGTTIDIYTAGTLVEIIDTDQTGMPYKVIIPEIVGNYPNIWIKESEIDHEATAQFNKE